MSMPEEVPPPNFSRDVPTSLRCKFCHQLINQDDEKNYHEILSWVHGPKLDGSSLRERTGRIAHKACIEKLKAGQAPDQEELF